MTAIVVKALVLRRSYPRNRLCVFDAFASADALEQWFSPASDISTRVIEFDFRSGGRYRIVFSLPDGTETSLRGEFTRIDRPIQLRFTWCWEKPDPHAGLDTLVTIDFVDKGGITEVVVSHEKMEDSEARDRHSAGWRGALERLHAWLELTTTRTE
jgi:uncharacterized protein YndB with AHSA1/START domain